MEKFMKEYKDALLNTQALLVENDEWVKRYSDYAQYIDNNIHKMQKASKKFRMPSELQTYMPISRFKSLTKDKVSFDVRYKGLSVAILSVDNSGRIELKLNKKCLKKFPENEQKFWDEKEIIKWVSPEGTSFRKYFKKLSENAILPGFHVEHQVESMLLGNFSLKSSKDKHLLNIQPVLLEKQRFPMPTAIKACLAKDDILGFAGANGGGIDILARFGRGRGTYLSVIELKDQSVSENKNEPPEKAIKQAISYATFIRELLRSKKTNAETWWKIFGFKEGSLPEKLKINAVIAMPNDEKNRIDFGGKTIYFDDQVDMIELHYLYFDKNLQGTPRTSLQLNI